MRSFDYLQSQNIIYNKRGIGYFVATGARELIHSLRKNTFFFEGRTGLLLPPNQDTGYSYKKEITDMYREFCKKRTVK